MLKKLFLKKEQIEARLSAIRGEGFSAVDIDEDGFRAYGENATEDEIRNSPAPVNMTWGELAGELGFEHGAAYGEIYTEDDTEQYGVFFVEVEPRVGDMVEWTDPETYEAKEGYTVTKVNGETITIHHDNGSEAEVLDCELRCM